MHLFTLVLVMCNIHTSRCDNYAMEVYKSSEDCEVAAAGLRAVKPPKDVPVLIYCTPTTRRARK